MVINIANFNFGGDGGGGGKPALLQEKTATIVQNGSQTITPDEGFDGMSSVQINAAITCDSSAIDFSPIGYDAEFSTELNANINSDVAYSKTLLDAWDPSRTLAISLYRDDKNIVYAPNIDTSNVTNMAQMFSGCTSLQTVPKFNTSKVTSMSNMFYKCSNLTYVPEFDTRNVTSMFSMFLNCTTLKTVPELDTSNVTDMAQMFSGCTSLTSVKFINTSKVTDMNYMFANCSSLTSVPEFNTINVTHMYNMFAGCTSLQTVPKFNTSKVTDMNNMFYGCTSITSIPELDTSKVTNFNNMLFNCSNLKTIEGISFKSFSASTMSDYYLVGFSLNSSTKKAVFKDIGYQSTAVQFNTAKIDYWGFDSDEIPDARQSLIDSLITYSFDRAAAGYPTCTIKLSPSTKSFLTSDEIAQIEAKGFTIA